MRRINSYNCLPIVETSNSANRCSSQHGDWGGGGLVSIRLIVTTADACLVFTAGKFKDVEPLMMDDILLKHIVCHRGLPLFMQGH